MRKLIAIALVLAAAGQGRAAPCDSNLLIVLDRSCSMDDPVGGGDMRTKWEVAVTAIGALTTMFAGKLNFGLAMFPDQQGMTCKQDGPFPLTVGPNHEQKVRDRLAATMPNGPCVTPITQGVAQVSQDPTYATAYVAGTRRSFVLLITDGMETCDSDSMTRNNIMALFTKGYPTYVVGFGGGEDPAALNMFATVGGVPLAGTTKYYRAGTAAELDSALREIGGAAAGDPEFGGCQGTPCPDNRCFATGESCVNKHCSGGSSVSDGGGSDSGADSGTGDGGDADSGCGCRAGRTGAAGSAFAFWVACCLVVVVLWRRRIK